MTRLEAREILCHMTIEELIDLWNEEMFSRRDFLSAVHPMSDSSWWNELFRRNINFCWSMVNHLLGSGDTFNLSDTWFFWDEDSGCFCSFSTKEKWLGKITNEDFFITILLKKHE